MTAEEISRDIYMTEIPAEVAESIAVNEKFMPEICDIMGFSIGRSAGFDRGVTDCQKSNWDRDFKIDFIILGRPVQVKYNRNGWGTFTLPDWHVPLLLNNKKLGKPFPDWHVEFALVEERMIGIARIDTEQLCRFLQRSDKVFKAGGGLGCNWSDVAHLDGVEIRQLRKPLERSDFIVRP